MDPNEKVSYEKVVAQYIEDQKLPDLMESYTKQLLLSQPEDPVQFLIDLINAKRSQRLVFITGGSQLLRNEIVDSIARHFNYHVIALGDDEQLKAMKTELVNEKAKQALQKVDSHFRGVIFSGYPFNFETAIFAQQNGLLPERFFLLTNSKADAITQYTAQFQGDQETASRAVTRDKLNNKELKQMYAGFLDSFKLSKMTKQAVIDNMKSILKIKDKVITPLRAPRILIMRPPHLHVKARSLQKALCQNYGFNEICTFDLLDWHIRQKTAIGRFIHQALENKRPIPDDIIVGLLRAKMLSTSSKQRGYVTEGFPRSKSQLQAVSNYAVKPDLILILDSDEDIMLNAFKSLKVDLTTGRYYEIKAIAAAGKADLIKEQNLVQNTVEESKWQFEVEQFKSLASEAQRVFGNHVQTFKIKRETEKDILAQVELLLSNQKVYS